MSSECQPASADGSTQSPDNTHSEFLCIMQLQSQLSQLDLILCYIPIKPTKAQFSQCDFPLLIKVTYLHTMKAMNVLEPSSS